jgi:hypothetical protein
VTERFWVCDSCSSLNDLRHKRCYRCRAERSRASTRDIGEGPDPPKDPSMFTALIVGLIMSVVAIYAWTIFETGLTLYRARFAGIVGVLIALAVIFGGRGRVSLGIVLLSFVLTVGTVFVGEYLVASAEIALRSPDPIDGRIPIADPKDVAAYVIERNGDDPIRPLLWVVAVIESLAVPWAALAGEAVRSRGAFRRQRKLGDDDDDR